MLRQAVAFRLCSRAPNLNVVLSTLIVVAQQLVLSWTIPGLEFLFFILKSDKFVQLTAHQHTLSFSVTSEETVCYLICTRQCKTHTNASCIFFRLVSIKTSSRGHCRHLNVNVNRAITKHLSRHIYHSTKDLMAPNEHRHTLDKFGNRSRTISTIY